MAERYSISLLMRVMDKSTRPLRQIGKEYQSLGRNVSQLETRLNSLSKNLNQVGANFQNIGQSLITHVSLPILAVGAAALKVAGDYEMLEASFLTMLGGSTEAAKEFVGELKQFAKQTPMETMDLAKNAQLLLNFGIAQEKIIPSLRMIGDVAGGNRDRMNSLALAFAQVQSTGNLTGQDLAQMINAGFNPLQVISEKTGKSMKNLKKAMSRGEISAEQVANAFKVATSEGGRFYKNMQRMSKTIPGLFSTMKDATTEFLGELGVIIKDSLRLSEVIPKITKKIEEFTKKIKEFAKEHPEITRFIVLFGVFLAILGPIIWTIGLIIKTIGAFITTIIWGIRIVKGIILVFKILILVVKGLILVFSILGAPVTLIIALIIALAVAAYFIIKHWSTVKKWLLNFWNFLADLFEYKIQHIKNKWLGLVEFFKLSWKVIKMVFQDGMSFILNPLQSIIKGLDLLKKSLPRNRYIRHDPTFAAPRAQGPSLNFNANLARATRGLLQERETKTEVTVRVKSETGSSAVIERVRPVKGKPKVNISNKNELGFNFL